MILSLVLAKFCGCMLAGALMGEAEIGVSDGGEDDLERDGN